MLNSECSINEYTFLAKLIVVILGLNFIMEHIFTCQMLSDFTCQHVSMDYIYIKNFLSALVAIS